MPRREAINSGNLYHVCNRGVDKRNIFLEETDYLRAIHDLFEFNNQNPLKNGGYFFAKQSSEAGRQYIKDPKEPRKLLVEVLAFCLMPNHFHLLLRQKVEGGIASFMHKLGTGYAKYFNDKYTRSGSLFQGRFKAVPVKQESHFLHLPFYIHLNPLDLVSPEWRERKIINIQKTLAHLESYRWSSHLDYAGIKNFPSVTQRDYLSRFFESPALYKTQILNWLQDLQLEGMEKVLLEPYKYSDARRHYI